MVTARFLLLAALPALGQAPVSVDGLGWLTGCWAGGSGASSYEENWMKPAAGTMLGVSRTIRNGKMVAHEFLAIVERDNQVFYDARPSGQAPTSFELVRSSANEAIFENLTHDFPQRIIYRRSSNELTARVESADSKKGQNFPMKAAACN